METQATPFLDALRRQIVAAAREGRDRQARSQREWAKRHRLLLATVAALAVASAIGATLLSHTLGAGGRDRLSTNGVTAPNPQALGPAPSGRRAGRPRLASVTSSSRSLRRSRTTSGSWVGDQ